MSLTTQYIKSATGGDAVQDINGYRIHTFTTVGTSTFSPATSGAVEVLVVAGGGGGGGIFVSYHPAGGGGAGEVIYLLNYPVSAGSSYNVIVGNGGFGGSNNASDSFRTSTFGSNSVFGTLTAQGGGRGGDAKGGAPGTNGGNGGSGGGSARFGTVNAISTKTIGFGNSGGMSVGTLGMTASGAGGGGAGGTGYDSYNDGINTPGGPGFQTTISGSNKTYGTGGNGGQRSLSGNGNTVAGNTGSGGNGASIDAGINWDVDTAPSGSNGSSGIVIVRYPLTMALSVKNATAKTTLTGTPLFSQLSQDVTSSAVGAFSLRAVNGQSTGGTARAVAVKAHPVVQWPPAVLSGFTTALSGQVYGNGTYTVSSSETENGNTNRRSWNLFNIGTETALSGFYHSPISSQPATVFNHNTPNNYTGAATTTINGNSVSGLWIQLNVPTSIILKSYQMITRTTYSLDRFRFPSTYYIIGSNDATFATWVQLDYKSYTKTDYDTLMTPIVVAGETRYQLTVNIVNYTPYIYYRLVVKNIISGDILNFSNFWLYGDAPSYAPNAPRDFYADRLGNLLTAPVTGQPLASWLGGATGYVVTWYDQSGAGNHATQATAANQPIIQKATKGPGYSCLFNGTTNYMNFGSSTILNGTNYSVCANTRRNVSGLQKYYVGSNGAGGTRQNLAVGYDTNASIIINEGAYATGAGVSAYSADSEPTGYDFVMMSQSSGMYAFSFRSGTSYSGGGSGLRTPLNNAGVGIIGAVATNGTYAGYFSGEIFELNIFTTSLFDLSGSSIGQLTPIPSIIQTIYQNQLSYTGV